MTDYTTPVLSEQKRDFLITMARIEIRRWGNLADQQRGGYMADLMRIALESLTAKPVTYKDSLGCFVTPRKGELLIQAGEAAYPLFMAPPAPVKQEGEQ